MDERPLPPPMLRHLLCFIIGYLAGTGDLVGFLML